MSVKERPPYEVRMDPQMDEDMGQLAKRLSANCAEVYGNHGCLIQSPIQPGVLAYTYPTSILTRKKETGEQHGRKIVKVGIKSMDTTGSGPSFGRGHVSWLPWLGEDFLLLS